MVFGDGGVRALQGVDLDVAPGEFVSLIGPSGCGKSTLLRLIGDLLAPSAGSISVNGKSPRQARLSREYGIVFQQPVLYDWRTVAQNVQLPLEVMRAPAIERRARADRLLHLVGLSEFADRYPWQLSGGMQQRVSIARALSFQPSLLLMDEPFGALDEMTRERLNRELLGIWSETGTTIIFVTHSIAEAVFLSDRVVVMSPRPGRVEAVITVDLPRPREAETRETEAYFELIGAVRHHLRELDEQVA
jgi:NitT/TauT family transport system ATP-binding protein